ncbi:MAG: hypothetical protein WDM79_18480 [Terricaulis sp.]
MLAEEALDYTELALSAAKTIGAVSLSAGAEYAPQQDNYEDDLYLWLGGVIALPHDARFYAQVGRDDGSMAPTPYAVDVTLGAAIMVSAFEFDISYVEVRYSPHRLGCCGSRISFHEHHQENRKAFWSDCSWSCCSARGQSLKTRCGLASSASNCKRRKATRRASKRASRPWRKT